MYLRYVNHLRADGGSMKRPLAKRSVPFPTCNDNVHGIICSACHVYMAKKYKSWNMASNCYILP